MAQILNNIFLIGNGFDLAHGYPTKYKDFYLWVIKHCFNNEEIQEAFVEPGNGYNTVDDFLKCISDQYFSNELFELMSQEFETKNWCDIESLYFSELIKMDRYDNVKDLNSEFNKIKIYLEKYLINLPYTLPQHEYFANLFNIRSINYNLILNCNYTKTLTYHELPKKSKTLNLHGELNNPDNPIIFGYSAPDKTMSNLRLSDNEYMRNIKSTNYRFTENYRTLQSYITNSNYRLIILGHSCSESDQLLLSDILNNEKISEIEILYHDREDYYQKIVNLQKWFKNENDANKIIEFNRSIRMPQKKETEAYQSLLDKYYMNK